jgi:hypothetical protein
VKRAAAALVAAAALAGPAAAGDIQSATAVVSPALASHQATLVLKLHFEMTCGRPGGGPLSVQLPGKMQAMPSLAARIAGAPATTKVSGDQVTVQLPRQHGISCMSIAPGTLTVDLTGVRNPAHAGTYLVRAHLRKMAFTARLAIHA